jgi:hypothetical protein
VTLPQQSVNSAAVSAALARLSNLQQLRLWDSAHISACCLVQLTRLTLLELQCRETSSGELQQLFNQPLPLKVLRIEEAEGSPALDLSQQTQLLEYSNFNPDADTVFPPQLQILQMGSLSNEDLEGILQLQQLRHLDFDCVLNKPELLLRLAQLPALESLVLWHYNSENAAATAAAWPKLPQLCFVSLQGSASDGPPTKQQWEAICFGLAACVSLTELDLEVGVTVPDAGQGQEQGVAHNAAIVEDVAICGKLTGLTNLKRIHMYGSDLVPGDALALTALTGLTRLGLHLAAGVGDLAATAIASRCKQLLHLDLSSCDVDLSSMACLAAIAQLTQLTELRLEQNDGLTRQGLVLLTGLKQLQTLSVDRNAEVTAAVVDSLWAALRQQQV